MPVQTQFTPPSLDSWEDPKAKPAAFTPPPVDSWQATPQQPQKASDAMLQPDQANQYTTTIGRALVDAATRPEPVRGMELLGGVPPGPPPAPVPPVPWETGLQTNSPPDHGPGLITGKDQLDIPQAIMNAMTEGAGRLASGVESMAEPGMRTKAGGLHQAVSGAFGLATPAMLGAGAAAPVRTALTIAATTKAQEKTEAGLKALGLPTEYAEVAGDLTGLVAGAATHKYSTAVKDQIGSKLKAKWEAKQSSAPPEAAAPKVLFTPPSLDSWEPPQQREYNSTGQQIGGPPEPKAPQSPNSKPEGKPEASPEIKVKAPTQPFTEPVLPRDLKGAAPRYNYGSKAFNLNFESDLDKAGYIAAQNKPSKADQRYVDFVAQHSGLDEADIRTRGAAVRTTIKGLAKDAEPGTLTVPAHGENLWGAKAPETKETTPNAVTVEQPEPKPSAVQTSGQEISQEVSQPGQEKPAATTAVERVASQAQPGVQPATDANAQGQGPLLKATDQQLLSAKTLSTDDYNTQLGHDIDAELSRRYPDTNFRRVIFKGDGYYVRPETDGQVESGPYGTEASATQALLDERTGKTAGQVITIPPAGKVPDEVKTVAQTPQSGQPTVQGSPPVKQQAEQAASGAEQAPGPEPASAPPEHSTKSDGVYYGSGLGAFEPLFREAKAEGDALRLRRNEALAAAKAAKDSPEEQRAGEKVRSYFTAERDLWAARANQAIDVVTRKFVPKIEDREALGIMREFRHRPGELQQMIDGTHPIFMGENTAVASMRREKLLPVMKNAMRMLTNPTVKEQAADTVFTNIAESSLAEGKKGGWMGSRWQSDEYVPHLLNQMGEGEVAKLPSTAGRIQGNIGKFFRFGLRRADPYPTSLHAVLNGIIPKTLDPSPAFTVHADAFARARATHLLEDHLWNSGLGMWGEGDHVPEGWVQLAQHSDEFKDESVTKNEMTGEIRVGKIGLYVPPFIERAMSPITDPDWTAKLPGFAKARTFQRGLKQAILGFSGYHLLTENAMAAADIGPSGMYRALKSDMRMSPEFQANERDLIGSGGTTAIQGSTMDAYRGLQPGTIPTRAEVIRGYIPGSKAALKLADQITHLTFDNVQRRFKVVSFALHRDAWVRSNPNAHPTELAEAKNGIASYVNGVYGGLHWENIGIGRASVEIGRFFILAPDWTGSNIALGKYAIDSRISPKELKLGPNRLGGAVTKESAQARLSRAFWTKQIVQGIVGTQMLSILLSGRLSPRPFDVYHGKDKDDLDVFSNVFFRGSAGDLVNLGNKMAEHGLLQGVGVFAGGKAAPVVKAGIHVLTGRDDLGRQTTPRGLNPVANTVRGVATTASDLTPIPIIARTIGRQATGDHSDRYTWSERMLSLFGAPAQHVPPPGTRMTKRGLAPAIPKDSRSTWDQIMTGKP